MQKIQTEILVIGGGATGTGVLRDLAMRGFDTILVEKRDLTHGTTGRFHGLLHSGARYAVKDPNAAQACIQENQILRRIMPACIEDSGGFFVVTPWDDPGYADSLIAGCHNAAIPVVEISNTQMLTEEPLLNPKISRCLRVPDAAVDSFAAAHANVASGREHGARTLTYHEVLRLLTTEEGSDKKVVGALCHDLIHDADVTIHADVVVNAAGAWCGKIGATAGGSTQNDSALSVNITMRPGKGTMIAVSQRIVNTVINRCRVPSDGDILVPAHTVSIIGTTDEQVADPDHFGIQPWEVQLMLAEGEKIIPGFEQMRMLRAWAGVRPLYEENLHGQQQDQSRDITRSFTLLDHEKRDNVPGLITITGGKWTTYRKMAAETVDLVCKKLNTQRECRTHLEELPHQGAAGHKYHHLGHRLERIEAEKAYGDLICECELVTRAEVEAAIKSGDVHTLDDIQRDLRLGMGPCQGGYCSLRAAGILYQESGGGDRVSGIRDQETGSVDRAGGDGRRSVIKTNVALRDFLEERWKGLLPVLWGKQLQQERLNELIYINVLNVEHLPGPASSRLSAEAYAATESLTPSPPPPLPLSRRERGRGVTARSGGRGEGVIIIGAGLAGLTAGWQAASRGLDTKVIAKGWGATHWGAGCIDVLATKGADSPSALRENIEKLIAENPHHPYAMIGLDKLAEALRSFQDLCQAAGYPMLGSLERNWLLPTATGATRPTCLAPKTMIAGDLRSSAPMLLVGFKRHHDFFPHFAAANLEVQGINADAVIVSTPTLQARRRVDTISLTHLFDQSDFRAEVAAAIKPHCKKNLRIGFPAVLGLRNPLGAKQDLESRLGCKVFEIPGLPPSVPGKRLHNLMVKAIQNAGGRVENGTEVIAISKEQEVEHERITAVWSQAAARRVAHTGRNFILATGGILGGGIHTTHNGHIHEVIFDLPIANLPESGSWMRRQFLHPRGHPIFRAGISVNEKFEPTNADGQIIYKNLFAIGNLLDGDFVRERSLEGTALASGYLVGKGVNAA